MLVQMLPRQKAHGLGHETEALVTVYWLACEVSYKVISDTFSMPLATVCSQEEMMTILHRVIHFPKPEEMEEVGAGFARLTGHEASRSAAGATSGFFLLQSHRKVLNNQKAFSTHNSAVHL